MIHLKDDFKEGDSVLNIKPSWLNQVAAFINYLHGRGCIINKPSNPSETNAPFIEVASGGSASLANGTPASVGTEANSGEVNEASRADHVHRDRYPNPGDGPLNFVSEAEGLANANQTTWGNGKSGGVTVGDVEISVVTRVRYNENDAVPQIRCFYRKLRIDPFGKVMSISGEGAYTVEVPSTLVLS